jgi:hypothetical protein
VPAKSGGVLTRSVLHVKDESGRETFEPLPGGMKGRRSRVEGACACKECGQKFVNNARLERHMHVHQVFGSYLCPLCGKTYKYEYNLFYHWRKTCKELDEVSNKNDRKDMDTNKLRQIVDEASTRQVRPSMGGGGMRHTSTITVGGGVFDGGDGDEQVVEVQSAQLPRSDLPQCSCSRFCTHTLMLCAARTGVTCTSCGLAVLGAHIERHMQVHMDKARLDEKSVCATWFCELCGLMFRYVRGAHSCTTCGVDVTRISSNIGAARVKRFKNVLIFRTR